MLLITNDKVKFGMKVNVKASKTVIEQANIPRGFLPIRFTIKPAAMLPKANKLLLIKTTMDPVVTLIKN